MLKWLRRLDPSYLTDGAALLVNQVGGMALGFGVTILFTKYASEKTYGIYGLVIGVFGVASLAALPGVQMAILYSTAKGHLGALRYGTWLRLKSSVMGSLGILVFASVLWMSNRLEEAQTLSVCVLIFPFLYAFNGFRSYLQGQRRFVEYAAVDLTLRGLRLMTIVIATMALHLEGTLLVAVFLAVQAVFATGVGLRYVSESVGGRGDEFDALGRNLTAVAVLGIISAHIDKLIVGLMFGPQQLAAYFLAVSLTNPLRDAGKELTKLLFPRIVKKDMLDPAILKVYTRGLVLLAGCLGLMIAAFWWGFPLVQPFLFERYAHAIPLVRWMIVIVALGIFNVVVSQILWGTPDLRVLYAVQVISPIGRTAMIAGGAAIGGVEGILCGQVIHYVTFGILLVLILLFWSRRRQAQIMSEQAHDTS